MGLWDVRAYGSEGFGAKVGDRLSGASDFKPRSRRGSKRLLFFFATPRSHTAKGHHPSYFQRHDLRLSMCNCEPVMVGAEVREGGCARQLQSCLPSDALNPKPSRLGILEPYSQ